MPDAAEPLHDPNVFELIETPYAVAPVPHPADPGHLARVLASADATDAAGQPAPFVCVFSDRDLAERFVELVGAAGRQAPYRFPTRDAFVAALVELAVLGHTHVGLDPDTTSVTRVEIRAVIAAARR